MSYPNYTHETSVTNSSAAMRLQQSVFGTCKRAPLLVDRNFMFKNLHGEPRMYAVPWWASQWSVFHDGYPEEDP